MTACGARLESRSILVYREHGFLDLTALADRARTGLASLRGHRRVWLVEEVPAVGGSTANLKTLDVIYAHRGSLHGVEGERPCPS